MHRGGSAWAAGSGQADRAGKGAAGGEQEERNERSTARETRELLLEHSQDVTAKKGSCLSAAELRVVCLTFAIMLCS